MRTLIIVLKYKYMKYFTCFSKWLKHHRPTITVLGLLIAAFIALGCNQAAKIISPYLSTDVNSECVLLTNSLTSGHISSAARPVKNISAKNNSHTSQYSTIALQAFGPCIYSSNQFTTGCTSFNNFNRRQFHHAIYLHDLSPPLFL